jgi:hypothetical protein
MDTVTIAAGRSVWPVIEGGNGNLWTIKNKDEITSYGSYATFKTKKELTLALDALEPVPASDKLSKFQHPNIYRFVRYGTPHMLPGQGNPSIGYIIKLTLTEVEALQDVDDAAASLIGGSTLRDMLGDTEVGKELYNLLQRVSAKKHGITYDEDVQNAAVNLLDAIESYSRKYSGGLQENF